MKLVRYLWAAFLLLSLSVGLFALQGGGIQRFGGRQFSFSGGANVPSEFYWSRLQYTSGYANGNSFGYRRFYGGWSQRLSQSRQRLPDRPAAFNPYQLSVAAERGRPR